ncbi:MAG: restriction endonuclease subunit S [Armatimonadota bacterium]|jgi:type I restriction enzyme S subunit
MSKEPTRFKQTEIGELPEEWEVIKVQEACDDISAEVAKVKKRECRSTGKYPVIDQGAEFISGYTDHEGACKDLPVIVFGDHTRIFKFIDFPFVRGADGVKVLRPKPNFHPRFLFYALSSLKIPTIGYQRHYSLLKEQFIPLPPLEEQKRIAGVLRLVDRVAEETRRIVSIYERAKRFALKRLLTRGIGHTRFKQTEMGELPEGWEVKPLREVLSLSQGGIWGDEPDNSVDVFPVLRSTEIDHEGNLHLDSPTMAWRKVPRQKAERYALKDGDILVVKSSGSAHLLGRVALFHQQGEQIFLFSNFLHRLRANDEICNSIFLYYVLISPIAKQTLKQIQETTSGLRNLPMDEYLQMPIPLPPLEEQKQIVEMLSTIDAAIENERRYLRVLEKCRRWLLDNLLTGKIRLSPEVDEILKGVLPDAF